MSQSLKSKTKKKKKIKNMFDEFKIRGEELEYIHRWNGWFAMLHHPHVRNEIVKSN